MDERADSVSPYASAIRQWLGRPVWLTVAASVVLIAAYAAAVVTALLGLLPLWAGALITFVSAHAGFSIAHEACHRAISGGAKGLGWLDWLLGSLHSWMLFYDFATFRLLHLRHHANTNLPANDPDYWLQQHGAVEVALRSLFIPIHYGNLFFGLVRRGEVRRDDAIKCFVGIGVLVTAFVTAIVAMPFEALVLWIGPAAAASSLINLSHRMLHAGETSRDQRRTTRIVVGDGLWEWLMCPFFWLNNHHLIHHESPRLPLISHKAVYAALEPELIASGADIIRLGRRAEGKPR
jgi:beta-carotene hydroxylase